MRKEIILSSTSNQYAEGILYLILVIILLSIGAKVMEILDGALKFSRKESRLRKRIDGGNHALKSVERGDELTHEEISLFNIGFHIQQIENLSDDEIREKFVLSGEINRNEVIKNYLEKNAYFFSNLPSYPLSILFAVCDYYNDNRPMSVIDLGRLLAVLVEHDQPIELKSKACELVGLDPRTMERVHSVD